MTPSDSTTITQDTSGQQLDSTTSPSNTPNDNQDTDSNEDFGGPSNSDTVASASEVEGRVVNIAPFPGRGPRPLQGTRPNLRYRAPHNPSRASSAHGRRRHRPDPNLRNRYHTHGSDGRGQSYPPQGPLVSQNYLAPNPRSQTQSRRTLANAPSIFVSNPSYRERDSPRQSATYKSVSSQGSNASGRSNVSYGSQYSSQGSTLPSGSSDSENDPSPFGGFLVPPTSSHVSTPSPTLFDLRSNSHPVSQPDFTNRGPVFFREDFPAVPGFNHFKSRDGSFINRRAFTSHSDLQGSQSTNSFHQAASFDRPGPPFFNQERNTYIGNNQEPVNAYEPTDNYSYSTNQADPRGNGNRQTSHYQSSASSHIHGPHGNQDQSFANRAGTSYETGHDEPHTNRADTITNPNVPYANRADTTTSPNVPYASSTNLYATRDHLNANLGNLNADPNDPTSTTNNVDPHNQGEDSYASSDNPSANYANLYENHEGVSEYYNSNSNRLNPNTNLNDRYARNNSPYNVQNQVYSGSNGRYTNRNSRLVNNNNPYVNPYDRFVNHDNSYTNRNDAFNYNNNNFYNYRDLSLSDDTPLFPSPVSSGNNFNNRFDTRDELLGSSTRPFPYHTDPHPNSRYPFVNPNVSLTMDNIPYNYPLLEQNPSQYQRVPFVDREEMHNRMNPLFQMDNNVYNRGQHFVNRNTDFLSSSANLMNEYDFLANRGSSFPDNYNTDYHRNRGDPMFVNRDSSSRGHNTPLSNPEYPFVNMNSLYDHRDAPYVNSGGSSFRHGDPFTDQSLPRTSGYNNLNRVNTSGHLSRRGHGSLVPGRYNSGVRSAGVLGGTNNSGVRSAGVLFDTNNSGVRSAGVLGGTRMESLMNRNGRSSQNGDGDLSYRDGSFVNEGRVNHNRRLDNMMVNTMDPQYLRG
ncbi:hypothetical protein Pmani_029265 [Petrolisthes manimaculis]|uniref:Uncharacterized protein n=1 Tax=Petrolisthes manimaculis TaxID=1843537 RepID=A0AAE1P0I8_9EUCA|nr:hypothetical protein Pmani_029265 [Petrolisthes manimaculis]